MRMLAPPNSTKEQEIASAYSIEKPNRKIWIQFAGSPFYTSKTTDIHLVITVLGAHIFRVAMLHFKLASLLLVQVSSLYFYASVPSTYILCSSLFYCVLFILNFTGIHPPVTFWESIHGKYIFESLLTSKYLVFYHFMRGWENSKVETWGLMFSDIACPYPVWALCSSLASKMK